MKKIIIGALLVGGLVGGYAFADGSGYGYMGENGHHIMGNTMGMMSGSMTNSDCRRAEWFSGHETSQFNSEQYQRVLDATASLRKLIHEKRFEYMEAQRKTGTTPAQLAEIEKQIIDLRTQIDEKTLELRRSAN